MTDDLVKRLRHFEKWLRHLEKWLSHPKDDPLANSSDLIHKAADRIEKLEVLVEQLRDDNSSLIDDFDKTFLHQESRIEKLEAALREIDEWAEDHCMFGLRNLVRKALEGKDD